MGFLENLKQILKIDVKIADKLREIKFIDVSNSGTKNVYKNQINVQIGQLVVPVDQDDKKMVGQVQKAIREAVQQENALVIEAESKSELDSYQAYNAGAAKDSSLQDLLTVVKPSDTPLLRSAFYLRKVHQDGNGVGNLKRDIVERYGERGKNVSNLCSAGYFETVVFPMLEELKSQDGFTAELFQERFEVIINSYPFAVFVSVQSNVSSAVAEVVNKIEVNKKYGIRKLKVHAIGHANIRKAQDVLSNKKVKKLLAKDPVITLIKNIFEAEIHF